MMESQVRRIGRTQWAALTAAFVLLAGVFTAAVPASASAGGAKSCPSNSSNHAAGATRVGRFAGLVRPVRTGAATCSRPTGRDPHNSGGTPPLNWHGGPMMSTRSKSDRVVVTPIYWAPAGYSFDPAYTTLINRYLNDAAHDSDKRTNVFSTLFEYNGSNGYINYRMIRGTPITDTNPYPAAGCTTDPGPVYNDNSGYTTCLDDAQMTSEINAQVASHNLVRDLGHMYVIFTPKHVESCFDPGNPVGQACTINATPSSAYCAYHSEFNGNTVYANMPFPIYASPVGSTCGSEAAFPTNESPNGNTDADVEISPLSHEMSEAITDPDTSTGWYDSSGFENGDECAYEYGAASGTAGALYNQTMNGHHYLTQEEFSNNNFNHGQGGCMQNYVPAAAPTVTAVSPNTGVAAGGKKVTITGTTLAGATAVHFGTVKATFAVVDPTHITATTPAHAVGTVDVTVQNVVGTSPIVAADHYTYT